MSQAGIINPSGMPAVPTTFVTDSGNATPALNVLNVVTPGSGIDGISTSGAGNTITITLSGTNVGTGQTIGAVTSDLITINLGAVATTYQFNCNIAGFESTGPSGCGYLVTGSIKTTGAAATIIPDPAYLAICEDVAVVPADIDMLAVGNTVVFRVTGVAGLTINWTAKSSFIKV